METLAQLSIGQMVTIGIVAVVLILLLSKLSKKGIFSFHGKGFNIGQDEREKKLLIDELTLARAMVDCIPVEHDDWKKRVVVEEIYNKIQDWIVKNNIRNTPQYISSKQYAIKSVKNVFDVLEDPDSFVEVLIKELVELKKEKLKNDV